MPKDDFYKKEFFEMLDKRLEKTDSKIDALGREVNDLKLKLRYIYGWAAGLGIAASILWTFLKEKISKIV